MNDRTKMVGTIPDVNRPILLSLLSSYGLGRGEPIDLGMVRDDSIEDMVERIRQRCEEALEQNHITIAQSQRLLQTYEQSLSRYTYLTS